MGTDQTVFNPARLWKLYGTTARKGDDLPERPHRLARLLHVPESETFLPVSRTLLETVAMTVLGSLPGFQRADRPPGESFDIEPWIESHGLDVIGPSDWQGGRRYILRVCPWDASHRDRSAFILKFPSGAVAAGCHHNSCASHDWHALRDAVEPGWRTAEAKAEPSPAGSATVGQAERKSQADLLVELTAGAELFHDPASDTYARVRVGEHHECWPTRSKAFKRWLDHQFYLSFQKVANSDAMNNAIRLLEARAQYEGDCRNVHLRVAPDGQDGIYLDLADLTWRAVHITENGWQIETEAAVDFRRSAGMLPLPTSVHGGKLEDLRQFVNVQDEASWALVKAWLRSAIRPDAPYPVLTLHGEQGSAKTSLARMLRGLFDPATPDLRSDPRELRDLSIAARANWLLGFDNVSSIPQWLSDALCRLATGGGWATRELYTDFDEVLFEARRPVLLNGITEYIVRGDLLDRALQVTLQTISDDARRDEKELWADYRMAQPQILGGLLDDVVAAIRTLPTVHLARRPRMADFSLWAVAVERGVGEAETFMPAYTGARAESHIQAIEGSSIGAPLQRFIDEEVRAEPWEGTATELLERLKSVADEGAVRGRRWPADGRALSGELRRLAPALRALGVDVQTGIRGAKGKRLLRVVIAGATPSPPSPASPNAAAEAPIAYPQGARVAVGDGGDDEIPSLWREDGGFSQAGPSDAASADDGRERFAL